MSVAKNEKTGKWDCQMWYKDWQGKRRHTTKTGFERKKDAEKYEYDFLSKKQYQDPIIDTAIDAYKKFLANERKLKNIKQTTYEHKIDYLDRCILPYFKGVKVSKITPAHIKEWLAFMSTNTSVKERLGSGTLNIYRSVLKQLYDFCMEEYKTAENPVKKVKRVKEFSNDQRVKFWTVEEYQKFYDDLRTETQRVLFNIIYWSGMRIGECLALTPADFQPYKIIITKSTETTKEEGQLTDTPKNKYSVREVEIPRSLYFQIMDYIESLYDVKPYTQIFAQFTASSVRNYIYYHGIQKLGLPKASTHTLRHTYASMLLDVSKDVTVVTKQIGHSNPSTTLRVYSHMLKGKDRNAVNCLEESINAEKEKNAKSNAPDVF
nr:MAG TPA: Integrase [Caudoviricetes sp.]